MFPQLFQTEVVETKNLALPIFARFITIKQKEEERISISEEKRRFKEQLKNMRKYKVSVFLDRAKAL